MIKTNKLSLALFLLSGIATVSYASGAPSPSNAAKNSIHVGLDLGYGALQSPHTQLYSITELPFGSTSYSTGNTTFGANVGYDFALTDQWLVGPELGYYNLGYSTYKGQEFLVFSNNTQIKSSAADLLARVTYMPSTGFEIFGKVGGAYVFQNADSVIGYSSTPASPSHSVNKLLPEADLGLGYRFANGFGLAANYQYIFGTSESNNHFVSSANRINNVYSTAAIFGEINYRFNM